MWSYVVQLVSLLTFTWWHVTFLSLCVVKDSLYLTFYGRKRNDIEPRNGMKARSNYDDDDDEGVVFYEGVVEHVRAKPVTNAFKYKVRVCMINLDDPPKWWSHSSNEKQLSLTPDYIRAECKTRGPVKLLTIPSCCGYNQNPISIYYAYEDKEATVLKQCMAEVTNTPWGEKVIFSFDPDMKEAFPKSLHVSPFMDMQNTWKISTAAPTSEAGLRVDIYVKHPDYGSYFWARLKAKESKHKASRSEEADLKTLLKYGYMPHRVAMWIYWQAVILLWKGVPFHLHPSLESYKQKVKDEMHSKQKHVKFLTWDWKQVHWPWNRA